MQKHSGMMSGNIFEDYMEAQEKNLTIFFK